MNRIELPTEAASSPFKPAALSFAPPRVLSRNNADAIESTPYATFAPMHYEPGYAYPLLIWLHGSLGNERQLTSVMPLVSMRNYVAIAPRGTAADRLQQGAFSWKQGEDDIEQGESRVLDCVAAAQRRFNVHPDRIFLAGVGCGGTMAFRIAWNNPQRFAGVASFGGGIPDRNRPLRQVNALRQLPCFVATGRRSRDYPEADVCRDLRLMHTAGCTVALRQYPCGNDLTTHMLADLNRWLMELVCGSREELRVEG